MPLTIEDYKKIHKDNIKLINKLEYEIKELKNKKQVYHTDHKGSVQELWFDVRESSVPNSGRGIFAKREFKKGDIVMSAPIIRFPINELKPKSVLSQYYGNIGDGTAFLCFDYQGLLNTTSHDKCNIQAQWRIKDGYSEFVATKDIKIGEELFQSYSQPNKIN
jgi:hypothetical protein